MSQPIAWKKLERWGIILVALHSFLVGALMLFFPHWTLKFAGWENVDYVFFVRQSGAFHFVVGLGYLVEYWRNQSISLLVIAKITAVVFLLTLSPWADAWAILFSGITDGMMLVGMVVVYWMAKRSIKGQS